MNGVFMDGGVVARPLSVGEIFDRALTVYVKQWRGFTLLAVIMSLPATWITYVTAVAKGQGISAAGPTKTPSMDQVLTMIFGTSYQHDLVAIWVSIGVSIVVTVVVYPAFLHGLRSVYEDRATTFSEWLAPGLHRYGRLLGILGLWLFVFLALAIAMMIPFVLFATLAGLSGLTQTAIAVVMIVLGICIFLVFVAVAIGLSMAFDWSLFIATDEDKSAVAAVRGAISRALRRSRFRRTVGIVLALGVLNLVVGFVCNAAISSLFVWTKSALLYTALTYLVSVPLYAYSGLVIAIYFLDSRLRDSATVTQPMR